MTYSFVFSPRMHEDISDCYSLVNDKNIQERMHNIDDFFMLHTAYFNPFLDKNHAEKKHDAENHDVKNHDVKNHAAENHAAENHDVKNHAAKNYVMVSPDFPLDKNQALQYLEDFRKNSLEGGQKIQNKFQSYSVNNGINASHLRGLSGNKFNQEEEFALDNFVKGVYEQEKTLFNENREHKQINLKKTEHKKIEESEIEQAQILKQTQILLILAWLQEEQDMDLFVIQQKISQKDLVIKSLLSDPYEKKFLESELSPMSNAEFYKDLHKDLLEKEEEIKASFSFNVLKEKKTTEKQILSYEWSNEDFNSIEFSTNWKKVFLAQLYFMPQNVIFVVNDWLMRDELLDIATDNKNQVQFDNDINLENYEEKEFVALQKMCSQNHLSYSFLMCPVEIIFKEKNQYFMSKYKGKKIAFLLKRD